jgi:hypothetical protein
MTIRFHLILGLILSILYGIFLYKIETFLAGFYAVLIGEAHSLSPRRTIWAVYIQLILPIISILFFLFSDYVSDWTGAHLKHGEFYTSNVIYILGHICLLASVIPMLIYKFSEYY